VKAVSADAGSQGSLLKPLRIYLATQCESATRAKLNKFFRETAKITGVNLVVQMLSDQTVILLDHEEESKPAANSPIDWIHNEIDEIPKTAKAVIDQAFRWASGETCDKKGSNFYREVESVANGRLNIDECKLGAFYTYNDSLITFSKAGRMSGSLRIYMATEAYVATWSKLNKFFRETAKITGFSLAVVGRDDKTVIEFTHYD